MPRKYAEITFTDSVKQTQEQHGSRAASGKRAAMDVDDQTLTSHEAEFIAERDSFYMATVNADGWPYVQFRGGPKGFLKVLDGKTLAYADFSGNRQYISTGNLKQNDRVSLFFMDYANRRRLKLMACAEVFKASDRPDLLDRVVDPDYGAAIERVVAFHLEAYDWNCPQHITPRFTASEWSEAQNANHSNQHSHERTTSMNVQEAIQSRRATRHLDPNHKLTEAELRQLCSAFALAPSSFNMQNRHAVAVVDQATKDKIMAAAWGQEHVGAASAVFVISGVLGRHHDADKFLRDAAKPVQDMFKPMVMDFYEGKESLQRDEACRSVGMAAMNLMLAAQELGLNSCPLIGFDPVQVADIVGLDDKHPALMLVVVGKATEEAHGRLGLYDLEDVVSVDRYDNPAITGSPLL